MNSLTHIQKYLMSVIFLVLFLISGCKQKENHEYLVGVSFQNLQNEFIIKIQDAMKEKAKEMNVKLIDVDGMGKAENQIAQTENFLAMDVDAIILNPYDEYGSAPVISIALKYHIPIVVVNSIVVNMDQADAYVGSNDIEAGRIAANHIKKLLNGKGNIAMIRGPLGHSAEIQRTKGIFEVVENEPEMEIVFDQTANWDRTEGLDLMENWISTGIKIDAVIAQNDEMALGAQKAIAAAGLQNKILIIGIDAIPDALRAVEEGELCATVFQDAAGQGKLALELAVRKARGEDFNHTHYIPFQLVTKENLIKFK